MRTNFQPAAAASRNYLLLDPTAADFIRQGNYTTEPLPVSYSDGRWTGSANGVDDGVASNLAGCRMWGFDSGRVLEDDIADLAAIIDNISAGAGELIILLGWCNGTDPAAAGFRAQAVARRINAGGTAASGYQFIANNNSNFNWSGLRANIADRAAFQGFWLPAKPGSVSARTFTTYNSGSNEQINTDSTDRTGSAGETLYVFVALGAATAAVASGSFDPTHRPVAIVGS